MNFIISLLVGGLLGWVVSMFMGSSTRQGIIQNVAAGIIGVVLGKWLLSGLLGSSTVNQGEFGLSGMLVSLLAAMVLLVGVQLIGSIQGRQARLQHGVP